MKKITAIAIITAMLTSLMLVFAPSASAAWDGTSVSAALVGAGTEFDPYLISNENDLAYLAKQVNDGVTHYDGEFFKLMVDLDLGQKDWTPIGALSANYFGGNFDGDGHTIRGLKVKTDANDKKALYGGVFGRSTDATFKNLTVEGGFVNSAKYAGAIVGSAYVTPDTGKSAIINCHVIDTEVRGLHVGGIVGRTSTENATKGQIEIIGCSATNVTVNHCTTEDFPSASNSNHYAGGIVGATGVAIISGCYVENVTINAYGTKNSRTGGIIGTQGADGVVSDVYNCYVNGLTLNVDPVCSPTNGRYGGLIGSAACITVSYGDLNTEASMFNCFVTGIVINDPTECPNVGVLMGYVNDTFHFNDLYYTPTEGLKSFGADKYLNEWPFVEVASLSDIKVENLNKGNSTAVWKSDVVKGHPIIDIEAVIANEPAFVDYYTENADKTEEVTTEAPVITDEATTAGAVVTDAPTDAPEQTDAPTEAIDSTDAPEQTPAPGTEAPAKKEEKGCGGMIAGAVTVIALLGTAVVFKKKN
ncbi:MAG: hypothetical protein IJD70_06760 [Clostridia bacterium]|nr:hypothetical protein [Clostridia bacterium]